jgi:hypothetical protein
MGQDIDSHRASLNALAMVRIYVLLIERINV